MADVPKTRRAEPALGLERKGPERVRRAGRRVAFAALVTAAVVVLSGFGVFVYDVGQRQALVADDFSADGIVVLTGGRARLEPAVDLLRRIEGARLLVSGVNAELGAETLRRTLGIDQALFACCVDIDKRAQDTAGNAQYTAVWAREHGFVRLIVVTNDYHMPRALLEMRRALPGIELQPFAVVNQPDNDTGWSRTADRYRVLAGEYGKYLVALARLS